MENRLPELRRGSGWTQAELAKRVGVSRQTIISIEKGKYDPSLPLAFKIARAFGTKIDTIFIDPDSPAEEERAPPLEGASVEMVNG